MSREVPRGLWSSETIEVLDIDDVDGELPNGMQSVLKIVESGTDGVVCRARVGNSGVLIPLNETDLIPAGDYEVLE